jgi:hypothetical protein
VRIGTSGIDVAVPSGEPVAIWWFSFEYLKGAHPMKLVQKRSCLLMLAFLVAYAGVAFAAPVAPFPGKSDSTTAAQAQPDDKPIDCKKYPKDPSCKKKDKK